MNQQPYSYVSIEKPQSRKMTNHDESRKEKQFTRRNHSGDKQKHQNPYVISRAQINQPKNKIYDFQTLISAFSEHILPPPEFDDIMAKIPHLFAKTPCKPLSKEILNSTSEEEEPEWMKQNEETFQMQDVETDLEKKRMEYQIQHGTFEKKQIEKQKKQDDSKDEKISTIENEKEKYRQMREQESKESQIAQETKAKLQELFNYSGSLEPIKLNQNVLSVEEIERQALKTEKREKVQKQEQYTMKKETPSFQAINKSDDLFEYLQKIGIQINEPLKIAQPEAPKFTIEKIKKAPFSIQAQLHQKSQQEKLWYYIDNFGKIQGAFPTENMDLWFEHKYLKPKLKISWLSPGKWMALDQFIINLELIHLGQLGPLKAMESVSQIPQQQFTQPVQQPTFIVSNNYQQSKQINTQNQQRQTPQQSNKNRNKATQPNYYNQNGFVFNANDFPTLNGNK